MPLLFVTVFSQSLNAVSGLIFELKFEKKKQQQKKNKQQFLVQKHAIRKLFTQIWS